MAERTRETAPGAVPSGGADQWWAAATPYLCIAALWVATRPYLGIVHDARLYAVQALHRLDPQRFAQDLYFAFGSQDSFTLFSAIYAPLVGFLGPAAAHGVATLTGYLCWVPALLWLTRGLFGAGWPALLAAVAVIVLNPYYGALSTFSYGEAFATPRLFAEAFVMVALAAALRGRPWLAGAALLGAGAFHPLMTLPGIAVVAALLLRANRGLWVLGVGIAIGGSLLAVLGVEPFSRAILRFDSAWLEMVRMRSPQALLVNWDWRAVAESTLPLVALLIALQIGSPVERRVVVAILGVAGLGLAASFLGGDLAHIVLVVNLQPWRVLWLLALIGNAWAGILVLRLAGRSQGRGFFLIALCCCVVEHWLGVPPFCSAVIATVALLAFLWEYRTGRALSRPLRLIGASVTASAMLFLGLMVWMLVPMAAELAGALALAVTAAVSLGGLRLLMAGAGCERNRGGHAHPVGWAERSDAHLDRAAPNDGHRYALPIVPSQASGVTHAGTSSLVIAPSCPDGFRRLGRGSVVLAGLLLLCALAVADRRTGWTRFIDARLMPDELVTLLEDAKTIYWEKGLEVLWFGLRRPDFYACEQGAGLMFFPGTAKEFRRRSEALHHLNTADFRGEVAPQCYPKARAQEQGPTTPAQLVAACAALPELELMVLIRDVPGVPSRVWRAPTPLLLRENDAWGAFDRFYFYRCADLR